MKRFWWAADRFRRRYGFAVCISVLAVILGLTAVWLRRALIGGAFSPRAIVAEPVPVARATDENRAPEAPFLPLYPPCTGDMLRGFSPDAPVWSETLALYETHDGVDYGALGDGAVYACADGRVKGVETDWLYGLAVRIDHGEGVETVYASLSSARVRAGDVVKAGSEIGTVGVSAACERALGAHVHFVYLVNGQAALPPFSNFDTGG